MEETMEFGQIKDLVLNYEAVRSVYDELNERLEEARKNKEAAEKAVVMAILDVAERTGIDDLKVKVEGRNYGVKVKDFFSIPKADRAEAYQLLKELGHGDLVVEKVDDRTLSNEMAGVIEQFRAENPDSIEEFPAEYEPLLAHMNRFPKPSLTRVMAR